MDERQCSDSSCDLVIIADDHQSRNFWPIIIIEQNCIGKDGQVRVVTVKTNTATFQLPRVSKLCKISIVKWICWVTQHWTEDNLYYWISIYICIKSKNRLENIKIIAYHHTLKNSIRTHIFITLYILRSGKM